ncbi:MAG: DMT family transporter [Rhodoferax sp.]|nr:DMT family transporter [Rhodoferax sp.]
MTPPLAIDRPVHVFWLQACGIFLCAMLALATLDMLAKDLVTRHPAPAINLVRYGVVLLMAVVLMRVRRTAWHMPVKHRRTLLWRGVMLGTVGLTFMQALHTMPLAEATAIYFLSPLIIVALSPWLLGEQVHQRQVAAVVAGFAGMLLIVRPGGALPLAGTVLMLIAAGAYAMLQIITRRLAGKVSMELQFSWTALICTAMTILSLPSADHLSWPGVNDLALMVLVGLLSGLGQYLLIKAFQKVSASSLAPFNYFHLLLAVVFSVLVFGQRPDAIALLGIAVIACAGLALTLPIFRNQLAAALASRQAPR